MATYVMFGKYSLSAVKGISAARTNKVVGLVKKLGGKVDGMYALLGEKDLIFIVTLPGIKEAMKASVAFTKATGIGFTTYPAVSVAEFDKIMKK